MLQANLAQVTVRQNEDVRKISASVAIVAVPTMIAGIYGMNFEHMPELGWTFGYPLVLGVMACICFGLYRCFKKVGLAAISTRLGPMADDCIFCKIVAGELPAEMVQEDEHTVAFMDINPWTRGHALVIPRAHSKNLYEVDEEDLRHTASAAKRLARGCGTGSAATGSTC